MEALHSTTSLKRETVNPLLSKMYEFKLVSVE